MLGLGGGGGLHLMQPLDMIFETPRCCVHSTAAGTGIGHPLAAIMVNLPQV